MGDQKKEYENRYVPGHKPSHIALHSWRTAENSCAYLLPTFQSMISKNSKLKLLDCGAGPGSISVSLAKYMPEGEVVATDLSAEVLQQAQQHATEQGVHNVKFLTASIFELPFPENSFDVVHAQQVLLHLPDPLAALKEMLRVCKPHGIVASRDADTRMWSLYPEFPGLVAFQKCINATMTAAGGSTDLGPRLVSLAMSASIPRSHIQASIGTYSCTTRHEREIWAQSFGTRIREGPMRTKVLEEKLGWTEEEMDEMGRDWDRFVEAEDGMLGMMQGEVIITKP